ncbi:MAG: cardiolipin synthetase, partial [Actinomycetota bacterium]
MTEPSIENAMEAWTTLIVSAVFLAILISIALVTLIAVPRNRRPQSALAWLLLIYLLPLIGLLLFLLLGSRRLPKRRREQQDEINRYIKETTEGIERVNRETQWPPWLEPIV